MSRFIFRVSTQGAHGLEVQGTSLYYNLFRPTDYVILRGANLFMTLQAYLKCQSAIALLLTCKQSIR